MSSVRSVSWLGRVAAAAAILYGIAALGLALFFDLKVRTAGIDRSPLTAAAGVYIGAWGASAVVGGALLVRQVTNPVGWLFSALGVTLASWGLVESYAIHRHLAQHDPSPRGAGAAVMANSLFIPVFVLIGLICALTPDGRYASRRWGRSAHMMVAAASVWLALRLISPEPLEGPLTSVANPWVVTSPDLHSVRLMSAVATMVLVAASVVSLVFRFVRARGEVRRQLLWLVVAAVPLPVILAIAFVAALTDNDVVLDLATGGLVVSVPLGAGLAVGRYHLYDVDRILSRAVAYVIVAGCLLATYGAVVVVVATAVGQAAGRSTVATTAATFAAVVIARPVYDAVRDALSRRFQRRRHEAVRQMRAFVADPPPERGVEAMLQLVLGDADLRVAYRDEAGSRWVTEHGQTTDDLDAQAVIVERSGRRVAAISTSCDDDATVRAVLDVATPELDNARLRAAIAVQLEEIRASRERIAQAQLNERRRVERDLHDGAQQRLLGVAAQMQAALLNGTPERLIASLELGVRESRIAVAELRALANGLHPAVLEGGGLCAALEDLSSRIPVELSIGGPQRRHRPLIEATMWFVACEAVSNAIKHADGSDVAVHLDGSEQHLRLVVEDAGPGGANVTGSGLRGITDRVEAAGGRLTITSPVGAGTRIEAVLPCTS